MPGSSERDYSKNCKTAAALALLALSGCGKSGGFSVTACSITGWTEVKTSTTTSLSTPFVPAVEVDAYGVAYVAAFNEKWTVFRGDKGGTEWSVVDQFQYSTDTLDAVPTSITAVGHAVYVTGYVNPSSGNKRWLTRRSTDQGNTWTTVDDFLYALNKDTGAKIIQASRTGTLYAAGYGFDTAAKGHALIRQSTDGGETWTTSDNYFPAGTAAGTYNDLQVTRDGQVVASGFGTSNVVRRSADGGATWTTTLTQAAATFPLLVFPVGDLWIPQTLGTPLTYKQSSDNGANWTSGSVAPLKSPVVLPSVVDPSGRLYSFGLSGLTQWTIQNSSDNGATWTTVDTYTAPSANTTNYPAVMNFDNTGNGFTAFFTDAGLNTVATLHVRKGACR